MKKFFKQFRYGQKGFTLIELLVVIAILGVLAAVAVPNIGKFIGKGKTEAGKTELANVLTAVTAAMADAVTSNITGGPFGNTTHSANKPYGGTDLPVGTSSVGAYITGGAASVGGIYTISDLGVVTQDWYLGDPIP